MLLQALILAAAASTVLAAPTPAIDPIFLIFPNSTQQCVPTEISWIGGEAPFTLTILDGNRVPVEDFLNIQTRSFLWQVNLPSGSGVAYQVTDSFGDLGGSPLFSVQPGNDDCTVL